MGDRHNVRLIGVAYVLMYLLYDKNSWDYFARWRHSYAHLYGLFLYAARKGSGCRSGSYFRRQREVGQLASLRGRYPGGRRHRAAGGGEPAECMGLINLL